MNRVIGPLLALLFILLAIGAFFLWKRVHAVRMLGNAPVYAPIPDPPTLAPGAGHGWQLIIGKAVNSSAHGPVAQGADTMSVNIDVRATSYTADGEMATATLIQHGTVVSNGSGEKLCEASCSCLYRVEVSYAGDINFNIDKGSTATSDYDLTIQAVPWWPTTSKQIIDSQGRHVLTVSFSSKGTYQNKDPQTATSVITLYAVPIAITSKALATP